MSAIVIDSSRAMSQIIASAWIAIQSHIDDTAKARGYADGVSCATYQASAIATWAAEASAFMTWRDAVWSYVFAELAKVQGGQRVQPSVAELVAELPAMTWPS